MRNQWMETEQAASQARNNYIYNLEKALDVSLQDGLDLQQQLAGKDQLLIGMERQLTAKDQAIQALQQQLQNKHQALQQLEQRLKSLETTAASASPIGVVSVASSVEEEEKFSTPSQASAIKKEPVSSKPVVTTTKKPTTTAVTEPEKKPERAETDSYKRKYAGGFQAAMERARELDKRRRMGK